VTDTTNSHENPRDGAPPSAALAASLADRYRIERAIGHGGMATVYLAQDLKHDRRVALKVLRPELAAVIGAERFLAEIRTTANLQHPHILPLHDSGTADGTVFYVMPYVEGESLRDRLAREKQLPVEEAIRVTREVAGALDYAHRHGVIHRDIKPENILLHDGTALVADFGIALAATQAGGTRMTETGMSLGTPHYMSPEQAMGEREITARSDIYALGCVAYEMLAGEPPFTGPTAQAIVAKMMTDEPRPLSLQRHTVPTHAAAAVRRALEKLPADRFQSAAEFAMALGDPTYASRVTVERAALGPVGAAYMRPLRGPGAALAAVTAISLALAAWGWLRPAPVPASGTIRFVAELDGVQDFPNTAPILVSPDGQSVVTAATVGRRSELVVRRLGEMATTVIPGAEGASRAFMSADGKWVGFSKGGKLMKLPVEGGTAVALAETQWGGGSWGEDGTIVYSVSYQSGLWMTTAAGGNPRMLTVPDSSTDELAHWWPQLLPDGKHVLFTAFRAPLTRATVEVLDLESGTRKVLVEGGVMGRYAASGHLLFARDESVLAVPFDLDHLAVTGAAVVVLDDVAMNPSDGFAAYDVSPTGTLAYLPASVAGSRFTVIETDRRGAGRTIIAAEGRYAEPRFAPGSGRISLSIRAERGTQDVWIQDLTRGTRLRLTTDEASDFGGTWTPDGRELVYMSERPLFELYRRVADGSRPAEPLLTGQHDRITGGVSADGRLLSFVLSVPGAAELWTVTLQGPPEPRKYLANGFALGHPAISPDGRWMAYDSDESGRTEVYAQSFPDPTGERHQVSTGGGSEPAWTRGGRELVFRRGDSVMAVAVDLRTGAAGNSSLLFAGPYVDEPEWSGARSYDVTPDGERLLLLEQRPGVGRGRVHITTNWFAELRERVPR